MPDGKNVLTLKWGTAKGWHCETDEAREAIQKWGAFGVEWSMIAHHSTPEQTQALVEAIDQFDEIWLDWDGRRVSREEAKEYVLNYGKKEAAGATKHGV